MAKRTSAQQMPTVPEDRRYLTPPEAHRLIDEAGRLGRHPERDKLMLRLMYRHGLRCAELCGLEWRDVNLDESTVYIKRLKRGKNATHKLERDDMAALRRLWKDRRGVHVFTSERCGPFSNDALQKIVGRAGVVAGLGDHIHPHMLRHGCGYALVNQGIDQRLGMDYLGHKTQAMFMHYSEVSPERLRDVRVV